MSKIDKVISIVSIVAATLWVVAAFIAVSVGARYGSLSFLIALLSVVFAVCMFADTQKEQDSRRKAPFTDDRRYDKVSRPDRIGGRNER